MKLTITISNDLNSTISMESASVKDIKKFIKQHTKQDAVLDLAVEVQEGGVRGLLKALKKLKVTG